MSEVHRYQVVRMLSEEGSVISYDPHGPWAVTADAHEAALAALREENKKVQKRYEDMTDRAVEFESAAESAELGLSLGLQREAALREELADMQHWRDLALQFDNHRMTTLWHLKTLAVNPSYAPAVSEFLASPPLPASEVVQRLTAAEQRNAELVKVLRDIRKSSVLSRRSDAQIDALLDASTNQGLN
jgi:hypothetical protein